MLLSTCIDYIWFISNFEFSVANKKEVIGCLGEGGMAVVVVSDCGLFVCVGF